MPQPVAAATLDLSMQASLLAQQQAQNMGTQLGEALGLVTMA
jgi:hypothetical protein